VKTYISATNGIAVPPNGPDDINELEMQLLQHDPAGLMLRYRSIVDTIVQMQINEGNIPRKEKEEFVHHILDAFLQRLPNILSQYNRRALLRTYCAAVFRNLCKDRIRQYHRQSAPRLLRESDMPAYNNPDPLSNLAIKEEVLLFGKVFSLFTRKKAKATLFLKAYFRLPLDRQDLLNYHPGLCAEEIAHWIRDLSVGEDEENIRLYRILGKLSRKAEGKSESAEAVRKWIRARLKDLVRCMNTSRDTRHTIETVRLLAERHFCTSEANAPELLTAMQGKE
jgi:DNA-directed RNA polymerase specialized sigma24 family protein